MVWFCAPGAIVNIPQTEWYQRWYQEWYQRGTNGGHHAMSRYVTLCMLKPLNDNDPQAYTCGSCYCVLACSKGDSNPHGSPH